MIPGSAPAGSGLNIAKKVPTATSPIWNNDFGTDIGPMRTFEDELGTR